MESTLNDLKSRRSIRKFKEEQISDEVLNKILEAGTYAPTGMGEQAPIILVIQRKDIIERLSQWNKSFFPDELLKAKDADDVDPFYGAPTVLIVLADSTIPTAVYDGSLVMGNLLNAAHALGVGACWIHRAKEEFDSQQGKELLKVWDIPEKYIGIGHCILGYPVDDVEFNISPRKEDYVIYIDKKLD
ncbi:MAG: nitroreductase family protein [Methanosphaera stadtmanae]|nr:nitroreductase family protein [Methanosphaera stadtmanae]